MSENRLQEVYKGSMLNDSHTAKSSLGGVLLIYVSHDFILTWQGHLFRKCKCLAAQLIMSRENSATLTRRKLAII